MPRTTPVLENALHGIAALVNEDQNTIAQHDHRVKDLEARNVQVREELRNARVEHVRAYNEIQSIIDQKDGVIKKLEAALTRARQGNSKQKAEIAHLYENLPLMDRKDQRIKDLEAEIKVQKQSVLDFRCGMHETEKEKEDIIEETNRTTSDLSSRLHQAKEECCKSGATMADEESEK